MKLTFKELNHRLTIALLLLVMTPAIDLSAQNGHSAWVPIGPSGIRDVLDRSKRTSDSKYYTKVISGYPGDRFNPVFSSRIHDMAVSGDGQRIYITRHLNGVWRSGDGGQSWEKILTVEHPEGEASLSPMDYYGIALVEGNSIHTDKIYVNVTERLLKDPAFLRGTKNEMHVSDDGGQTWRQEKVNYRGDDKYPFEKLVVDPNNPDLIIGYGSAPLYKRVAKSSGYEWDWIPNSTSNQVFAINDNGKTIWMANQGRPTSIFVFDPLGKDHESFFPVKTKKEQEEEKKREQEAEKKRESEKANGGETEPIPWNEWEKQGKEEEEEDETKKDLQQLDIASASSGFLRISFKPNDPSRMYLLAGDGEEKAKIFYCDITYDRSQLPKIIPTRGPFHEVHMYGAKFEGVMKWVHTRLLADPDPAKDILYVGSTATKVFRLNLTPSSGPKEVLLIPAQKDIETGMAHLQEAKSGLQEAQEAAAKETESYRSEAARSHLRKVLEHFNNADAVFEQVKALFAYYPKESFNTDEERDLLDRTNYLFRRAQSATSSAKYDVKRFLDGRLPYSDRKKTNNDEEIDDALGKAEKTLEKIGEALTAVNAQHYPLTLAGKPTAIKGVGWDTYTLKFTPGKNQLWIGGDHGFFVNDEPDAEVSMFRPVNQVLPGALTIRFSQHPTEDAILLAGGQDCGNLFYTGDAAWREIWGGDGGYSIFDWSDPCKMLHNDFAGGDLFLTDMCSSIKERAPVLEKTGSLYGPIRSLPQTTPATPEKTFAQTVITGAYNAAEKSIQPHISTAFGEKDSWEPVPLFATNGDPFINKKPITAIAVASTEKFYVGTYGGNMFVCTNDAGNWSCNAMSALPEELKDRRIRSVAVDPTDDQKSSIYMAVEGKLSTQIWHYNGQQWTKKNTGLPQLKNSSHSLAVDPHVKRYDGQQPYLYVGGKMGVWRLNPDNSTWEPFNTGLPEGYVEQVEFHPTRHLLRASIYGYGLFECAFDDPVPDKQVKLYLRSTQLDRGLYFPVKNGVQNPLDPEATLSIRQSPDIKIAVPDNDGKYFFDLEGERPIPEAGEIDFTQYLTQLKDRSHEPGDQEEAMVFVQVHNRGPKTASGAKLALLQAPLNVDGSLPALPDDFYRSVANGDGSLAGENWETLDITEVDGAVAAALPEIEALTFATETTDREYAILALLYHPEDGTLDQKKIDAEELCRWNRKAAMKLTRLKLVPNLKKTETETASVEVPTQSTELHGRDQSCGFGGKVILSEYGNRMAVLNEEAGKVEVYEYRSGDWTRMGSAISGEFDEGDKVIFAKNGNRLALGNAVHISREGMPVGMVKVYEWNAAAQEWDVLGAPIIGDNSANFLGEKMAFSADGNILATGSPRNGYANDAPQASGVVRVFKWQAADEQWKQIGQDLKGTTENEFFGGVISLSDGGNYLAIAASDYYRRNEYAIISTYKLTDNQWVLHGSAVRHSREVCESLALSRNGEQLFVGIPSEPDHSGEWDSGQVIFYKLNNDKWEADHAFYARVSKARWGKSLALSKDENTLMIGADSYLFETITHYSDGSTTRPGETPPASTEEKEVYAQWTEYASKPAPAVIFHRKGADWVRLDPESLFPHPEAFENASLSMSADGKWLSLGMPQTASGQQPGTCGKISIIRIPDVK